MKEVIIIGQTIQLKKLERGELKEVFIDALLRFEFYRGVFNGHPFILLENKKSSLLKPLQYKQLANRLGEILSSTILFEFSKLETYQRNRFIQRGVYFVVSDKYVFLPFLIINAKGSRFKEITELTPVAQYLLLSHIQNRSYSGLTIKEIEELTPYKYVTLTRAVRVLEDLDLCQIELGDDKAKRLSFMENKALWEKAQKYLINPIDKKVFCSDAKIGLISSYNALAHYSNLNRDYNNCFALYSKHYKEIEKSLTDFCVYEGDTTIELWKYPPIGKAYVDRLSLFLTLKEDKDPRVKMELDKMINEIWL